MATTTRSRCGVVLIPKGDGKTRPLGIPTLEDKIVQQAARMVLGPILEAEFIGFSYGLRPGRSPHDALDALAAAIRRKVSWVLDADIEASFDTIDHRRLQDFVEHRIGDARMVRLLMKWLKAGVMEEGKLHETQSGTPQGGIVSPLLANLYLHCSTCGRCHGGRSKRAARCTSCATRTTS